MRTRPAFSARRRRWLVLGSLILSGLVLAMPATSAGSLTIRVSVDAGGQDANGGSAYPSISADGRFIAFVSTASDLVPGDGNGRADVFVRDMSTGTTVRASVDAAGGDPNGSSTRPSISADGRYVAFESSASDMVPGDTGRVDVFVRDLVAGVNIPASVPSSGGQPNGPSYDPAISADGRYVAFESTASNLVPGDGNGRSDIFLRDLVAKTTERISLDMAGGDPNGTSNDPAINADGRFVAYRSFARDLIPRDGNNWADVFLRDRQTGTTVRASVDVSGGDPNVESYDASLDAEARFVAYASYASDHVPDDFNEILDVFVWDRLTGQNQRVSVDVNGQDADNAAFNPSISSDGRYVAFDSWATDLVPGDTNGRSDVFIRDLLVGTTVRVSLDTSGGDPDANSLDPAITADGGAIAFWSHASDLVSADGNGMPDVFFRVLGTG